MLVNKYTAVHGLFVLFHSALTNVTNVDFNNVLVNVEININKDSSSYEFMLTNVLNKWNQSVTKLLFIVNSWNLIVKCINLY